MASFHDGLTVVKLYPYELSLLHHVFLFQFSFYQSVLYSVQTWKVQVPGLERKVEGCTEAEI